MNEVSPYLVSVVASWVIAQVLKYLIKVVKTGDISQLRQLYLSGNMPSAHSASVVALATVIGLSDGLESGLFALAALLAAIVMYDSVMVRRSSGEQGAALQVVIKETNSRAAIPRTAKGHTPFEVLGGAILGCVIGLVVFLAT